MTEVYWDQETLRYDLCFHQVIRLSACLISSFICDLTTNDNVVEKKHYGVLPIIENRMYLRMANLAKCFKLYNITFVIFVSDWGSY